MENEVIRYGIGLCGAQRVGKTTLAKLYADRFDVPYVVVSASGTLARFGCDAKTEYPIERRLELQTAILEDAVEQWSSVREDFITDRTPIDFMTYMIADVTRASVLDPEVDDAIQLFMKRCVQAHMAFFDMTMLIQPGIALIEDAKSAPAAPAFMRHFNSTAIGLMYGLKDCTILDREILNLEDRLVILRAAWMRLKFGH